MGGLPQGNVRLIFRLYGGWNIESARSSKAQQIFEEVSEQFPAISFDRILQRRVGLSVELAESLLALPYQILPNTYRKRARPPKLHCLDAAGLGCTIDGCPSDQVRQLFRTGNCPGTGCQRSLTDIVIRSEQKLVDTMMVADLLHLSSKAEESIVVVSSDDDLWPGMLTAMSVGTRIWHITTKSVSSESSYIGSMQHHYSTVMI